MKAFTLVELLVAITISAIVMGAATFALSTGMRAHARIAAFDTTRIDELNLFRALQHDISSATPLGAGAVFTGTSTEMTLTRLVSPNNTTDNVAPVRIEWRVESERIVRTIGFQPVVNSFDRRDAHRTFSYRSSASPQWLDTWNSPGFPAQVRYGDTVFTIWTTDTTDSK